MSASTATKGKRSVTNPERKFGPFAAGVAVNVWLNQVKSDDGPRFFRSVTISPRRFRDEDSGEWRDSGSLRSTDIPALILGLQAAFDHIRTMPLPGEPAEEELPMEVPTAPTDGPTPF